MIVAAIGVPIAVTQGRARREAGLVTDPGVAPLAVSAFVHSLLAVTAFVLSFLVGVAGVVRGHMARAQLRKSDEADWALATLGLLLGHYATAIAVLGLLSLFIPT